MFSQSFVVESVDEGQGESRGTSKKQFLSDCLTCMGARQAAEAEAESALNQSEVPVGCVFVRDSHIVARGHNLTNIEMDATRHAEMVAIDKIYDMAGNAHQSSNSSTPLLVGCTLYVTCEPCIMCAAAIGMLGVYCESLGIAFTAKFDSTHPLQSSTKWVNLHNIVALTSVLSAGSELCSAAVMTNLVEMVQS